MTSFSGFPTIAGNTASGTLDRYVIRRGRNNATQGGTMDNYVIRGISEFEYERQFHLGLWHWKNWIEDERLKKIWKQKKRREEARRRVREYRRRIKEQKNRLQAQVCQKTETTLIALSDSLYLLTPILGLPETNALPEACTIHSCPHPNLQTTFHTPHLPYSENPP